MTRLIVAVDGSDRSFEALRWGAEVGDRIGADVCAITVWGPGAHVSFDLPQQVPLEEGRAAVVTAVEKAVAELGLRPVEVIAGLGSPADVLREVMEQPGVVGIVMGTRGLGTLPGLLLGSVSRKLLFTSNHPLFLLPERAGETRAPKHILIAVDGSEVSGPITQWGAHLCARLGAAATVIRCVDPGAELPAGHVDMYIRDVGLLIDERWCEPLRDCRVHYRAMAVRGDPRHQILEVARDRGVDLIVAGGRGEGQFQGMGGTTSYLVRHSTIPLAVVPSARDWEPAEL